MWDCDSYQSKSTIFSTKKELNSLGNQGNMTISYSYELKGHTKQVEDISFNPRDRDQLISVSDD